MNRNALRHCAGAALLASGATSASFAAMTITYLGNFNGGGGFLDRYSENYAAVSSPYEFSGVDGANALTAWSYAIAGNSVSVSATSSSGWTMDYVSSGTRALSGRTRRNFQVSGATGSDLVSITVNAPIPNSFVPYYTLEKWSGSEWIQVAESAGVNGTFNHALSDGIYNVSIDVSARTFAGSGTFASVAFVPAPGALALLGVAGIVGARRRR